MPTRLGLEIASAERQRLKRLRAKTRDLRVWARVTAILLWGMGWSSGKICELLAMSRATLANWIQRWRRGKFFQLEDAQRSGRPPRITERYVGEMIRCVRSDPRLEGYAFTRWTAARLAEHLGRKTGIRIGAKWMAEILKQHGFVWRRTRRTMRNLQDQTAVKIAQKRLNRLKKGLWREAPTMSCGMQMERSSSSFLS